MATLKPISQKIEEQFEISDVLASNILHKVYPDTTMIIEQRIDRAKAVLYVIDYEGEKEVLRLSASPHYSTQSIATAYQAWEQTGIPVPHVRAAGSQDSIQYLLMDYISESLFHFKMAEDMQLKIVTQMGGFLAQMRNIERKGFGYFDPNGKGTFSTWSEWVKSYCHYGWLFEEGYLNSKEVEILHKVEDFGFSLDVGILLHGDYKPKNIFVTRNNRIAAITDPLPLAGDPLWDFAVFNHFIYREQARRKKPFDSRFFADLRDVFRQGYEEQLGRKLQDDELYRVMLYEILIDASKTEKLLLGKLKEAKGEGDFMLAYLKHKIRDIML